MPLAAPPTGVQREEPVGAGGRTRGKRHQADVRFGSRCRTERQLYEVQLTPDCYWAVSLLRRLLHCRANWRYRPSAVLAAAVVDSCFAA